MFIHVCVYISYGSLQRFISTPAACYYVHVMLCVYMYIYTYKCMRTYLFIYTCIYIYAMALCNALSALLWGRTMHYVYKYIHVYQYIHMHIYTYVYIYIYIYIYINVYICIHVYVYMCIYIYHLPARRVSFTKEPLLQGSFARDTRPYGDITC